MSTLSLRPGEAKARAASTDRPLLVTAAVLIAVSLASLTVAYFSPLSTRAWTALRAGAGDRRRLGAQGGHSHPGGWPAKSGPIFPISPIH